MELSYLTACVGRPSAIRLLWVEDGSIWDGADMWALPQEPREQLLDLYRSVWTQSDASIAELDLAAPAQVSWWAEDRRVTTFGHLLVRVVAESGWLAYHAQVQAAAEAFR